jgi:SPP1 family predicted phage head-tail adaptor
MKPQAQRYRHRVEIQERVEVQDSDTLEITFTWETVALDSDTELDAVPAEVLTGPGRELNAADSKQAEVDARIFMGWFPGLTQAMRVLWDGKTFDIVSIETDATARREYRLRCKAGVNSGA